MTTDRRFERAAVDLAARGYHVFPVKPRGKEPLTEHGWQDATRDERTILQWWDRWPTANIGIACGPSGISVADMDSKAGADPRELLPAFDGYPVVWTGEAPDRSPEFPNALPDVRGAHVYFRAQLPTTKTTLPGVEVRGIGAYVLAPPSVHPSGVEYEGSVPAVADLPEDPAGVTDFLIAASPASTTAPEDDERLTEGTRHAGLGHARPQRHGLRPAVGGQGSRAPLETPPGVDTLTLVTTKPPPLDGVFARGKLAMIGGREKRGKSLITMAFAVAMACGGIDTAGITVKAGRVLLIDAENGEREIHRRLRAMGLTVSGAPNFVAVEARGFDLREDLGALAALIDAHAPDLVVLDSFRALWRGDERDEAQVADALDPLRDLAHDREIATGLVHHAQKGGEEYRGSTAIGAAVEWVVMLDRAREDDDKTRRRLSNPLARFAQERDDRWLSIQSAGDDGPVALAEADAYHPPRERDALRDDVLAQLTQSPQSARAIAGAVGSNDKIVGRVLRDLEADGLAANPHGGWVRQLRHAPIEDDAPVAPQFDLPDTNGHGDQGESLDRADFDPEGDA
jgi:hypothetical protein